MNPVKSESLVIAIFRSDPIKWLNSNNTKIQNRKKLIISLITGEIALCKS